MTQPHISHIDGRTKHLILNSVCEKIFLKKMRHSDLWAFTISKSSLKNTSLRTG
ncbi:Uncharacterised protein [Legionella israelensis]|nr:Uncharacterised protein [Legionella israelensis]